MKVAINPPTHTNHEQDDWQSMELFDEHAVRRELESASSEARGALFLCHGSAKEAALQGDDGNPALDRDNLHHLRGAWIHAFACQSSRLAEAAAATGVSHFAGYKTNLICGWDPETLPKEHAQAFFELCVETTRQLMSGCHEITTIKHSLQLIADRLLELCNKQPPGTFVFQALAQQVIRDLVLVTAPNGSGGGG